ncbi:hypothetical protein Tco_1056215 [Tanacetum coccineum]|uniref:Uncharacterized protein n=1 Tax=Tanacetum coccineum TaxID=301880 RepID=A0ABQ5H1V5_9ASTR
MSSTHDLSTSTYDTISFESKWKMEWLNSTSWKQTINWQISSQNFTKRSCFEFYSTTWDEGFTLGTPSNALQARTVLLKERLSLNDNVPKRDNEAKEPNLQSSHNASAEVTLALTETTDTTSTLPPPPPPLQKPTGHRDI